MKLLKKTPKYNYYAMLDYDSANDLNPINYESPCWTFIGNSNLRLNKSVDSFAELGNVLGIDIVAIKDKASQNDESETEFYADINRELLKSNRYLIPISISEYYSQVTTRLGICSESSMHVKAFAITSFAKLRKYDHVTNIADGIKKEIPDLKITLSDYDNYTNGYMFSITKVPANRVVNNDVEAIDESTDSISGITSRQLDDSTTVKRLIEDV